MFGLYVTSFVTLSVTLSTVLTLECSSDGEQTTCFAVIAITKSRQMIQSEADERCRATSSSLRLARVGNDTATTLATRFELKSGRYWVQNTRDVQDRNEACVVLRFDGTLRLEIFNCSQKVLGIVCERYGNCPPDVCQVPQSDCRHAIVRTCKCGYQPDADSQTCTDVDECANGSHNCSVFENCANTDGSFECAVKSCLMGYQLSYTSGQCEDINECSAADVRVCTHQGELCQNTVGSYRCVCQTGYMRDFWGSGCIDVDECLERRSLCTGETEICNNTVGSYRCVCQTGYRRDYYSQQCVDVDECYAERHPVCRGNGEICRNTVGSYRCECREGYKRDDGGRQCVDSSRKLLTAVVSVGILLAILVAVIAIIVVIGRRRVKSRTSAQSESGETVLPRSRDIRSVSTGAVENEYADVVLEPAAVSRNVRSRATGGSENQYALIAHRSGGQSLNRSRVPDVCAVPDVELQYAQVVRPPRQRKENGQRGSNHETQASTNIDTAQKTSQPRRTSAKPAASSVQPRDDNDTTGTVYADIMPSKYPQKDATADAPVVYASFDTASYR